MTSRQWLWGGIILGALVLWPRRLSASIIPEDSIIIMGPRRETLRPTHGGQSVVIRPSDETRFDLRTQLRKEASLILPETGRINASGFSVPRVRGQDARSTEIYLEGLRIQDPYMGYPFIDDLDLRATGEMALYMGTPPPEFASVNPNGSIDYRLFSQQSQSSTLQTGTVVGRPYGTAVWTLGRYQNTEKSSQAITDLKDGDHLRFGFYGRKHWTQGRYSYYDDNATPYNPGDDRYIQRTHGDRVAQQSLPYIQWQRGKHQLLGLGFWNQSKTSLPARLSGVKSQARENSGTAVVRSAYRYTTDNPSTIIPNILGIETGIFSNKISMNDPREGNGTGGIGSAEKTSRDLSSQTLALTLNWKTLGTDRPTQIYTRAEESQTRIAVATDLNTKFKVHRHQGSSYAGIDWRLSDQFRMETKWIFISIRDQLKAENDEFGGGKPNILRSVPNSRKDPQTTQASSWGLLWHRDYFKVYSQLGQNKRAPTLLEEFGDGAMIRENSALEPETTTHREFGLDFRLTNLPENWEWLGLSQGSLRTAVFRDDTRDRIILLPSVGQTLRAQNALRTQISGYEVAGEVERDAWGLVMGYARLYPEDQSFPGRPRLIPGTPEHVATTSLGYRWGPSMIRISSRFQSQVWRDSDNSIAVPGYSIFDATLDAKAKHGHQMPIELGLGVYNFTDERRLPIQASGTRANRGYTSYSDFGGMPLPGRQWRVSLSAHF